MREEPRHDPLLVPLEVSDALELVAQKSFDAREKWTTCARQE
jgi:hypothetical protein